VPLNSILPTNQPAAVVDFKIVTYNVTCRTIQGQNYLLLSTGWEAWALAQGIQRGSMDPYNFYTWFFTPYNHAYHVVNKGGCSVSQTGDDRWSN